MKNTPKAIGYIRVSTSKQKIGPEAQRDGIEAKAKSLGFDSVAWFEEDAISGGKPVHKRPKLRAAIDAVKPGDKFIVMNTERLARKLQHLLNAYEEIKQKKGRLVSVAGQGTEDTDSDLLFNMTGVIGEEARMQIKRNTVHALNKLKRNGQCYGPIPYGYKKIGGRTITEEGIERVKGGDLVPDETEFPILQRIVNMKTEGMSLQGICDVLNEEGILSKKGKQWNRIIVYKIIGRYKQNN